MDMLECCRASGSTKCTQVSFMFLYSVTYCFSLQSSDGVIMLAHHL